VHELRFKKEVQVMAKRTWLQRVFSWPVISVSASLVLSSVPSGAADVGQPTSLRINASQYHQTIADIFGTSIAVNGRFEPDLREEGMAAIGAARASFSPAGIERYDELARGIARQVTGPQHRDILIQCKPQSPTAADEACARSFLSRTGPLLYRRPLKDSELQTLVKVASDSANTLNDFYAGLSTSLVNMLISPDFLFKYRKLEADPANPGRMRLDSYSKATALSFFLWNSSPDELLLEAAEKGELHTKEGLTRQVDRMLSAPSLETGVRAFFADMLGFSKFEILSKDPAFFPRFTSRVKDDAQEQTLRTIVDHLILRQGDYRDLFTTPNTFMTRSLATLYGVPLPDKSDNGQPMHWQPYSFAEGDPRAGLLSQISFVALHSPAGRTSPTDRGKALREYVMCQTVPAPPGNVDFQFVQDTANPDHKTARDRLLAHAGEAMCAGCHKITDPLGLALEKFDSSGTYRTRENGVLIDTSGELRGKKFDGPAGLAQAVREDPAVTSCVARRAFAFGTGHMPPRSQQWRAIEQSFAESKYKFPELLRQIALSDMLFDVSAEEAALKAK
jgi:hypothetical protein